MRKLQESEDEQDKDVKMSDLKGKQENLKIQLDGKFTQDEF